MRGVIVMADAEDVAPNRLYMKRLIDDACRRLGTMRGQEPYYRGLAESIGLDVVTLTAMFRRGDTLPAWRTLFTLRDKADIPMVKMLMALDVLRDEDITNGERVSLSDQQRQVLDLFEGASTGAVDELTTWIAQGLRAGLLNINPGEAPKP